MPSVGRHGGLRSLLSSYVDGQVTDAERARVEGHVASCGKCRAELAGLREAIAMLRALPRLETPRSFALAAPPASVRPALAWALWPARLATAGAALLLAVLLAGDALGILGQGVPAAPSAASVALDATTPSVAAEAGAQAPAEALAAAAPGLSPMPVAAGAGPDVAEGARPPEVAADAEAPAEGLAAMNASEGTAAPAAATRGGQERAAVPETSLTKTFGAPARPGLALPLRQLEWAAGVSVVACGLALVWMARRPGRRARWTR